MTCSQPKCSRTAIKGAKLCAKCKGKAWAASHQPVTRREQLVEDSGLRFTEAGMGWLDKLSWPDLNGLIDDLLEQEREFCRLVARDG